LTDLDDFDIEEFLLKKLEEIPGTDLYILMIGGMLGAAGWTPVTALLNMATGASRTVAQNIEQSNAAIRQAGFNPDFFDFLPGGIIAKVIAPMLVGSKPPPPSAVDRLKAFQQTLLMAGVGAMETFALTRPGTVGGILQGIGSIIPL
jgi:hypothetical protein